MSHELELKYAVLDPTALESWLDAELPPAPEGWRDELVVDTYVDTPDGALAAAGYGARLRRRRGSVTVGLKSDIDVEAGLHRRNELEAPARDSLAVSSWPPSVVRERVAAVCGDRPLIERFVLHQARREREVRAAELRCLLSLDHVSVRHRGIEVGTLDQLEVELLAGPVSALRALGERIEGSGLIRPEQRSKLASAQRLISRAALTRR